MIQYNPAIKSYGYQPCYLGRGPFPGFEHVGQALDIRVGVVWHSDGWGRHILGFKRQSLLAFTCFGRIKFIAWRPRHLLLEEYRRGQGIFGPAMHLSFSSCPVPTIKNHVPYSVLIGRQSNTPRLPSWSWILRVLYELNICYDKMMTSGLMIGKISEIRDFH